MHFQRFYDEKLAQASYMIASGGQAIIVDPGRDVELYLNAAKEQNVAIAAVTETHIHADFVSGARELAARAGAALYLSDEGGPDWKYAYANGPNVKLVRDGDLIEIGSVRIRVVHTPGHTPEHISFMIHDLASSPEPLGVLTGDFIFVGDVGRPDLLERAANMQGTMTESAKQLFRSLAKTAAWEPHLLIWPGHGAGSACGKNLGSLPVSSIGYERASNWGLKTRSESEFVAEVLEGQPDPPAYFKRMKQLNRQGPPFVSDLPKPKLLRVEAAAETLHAGDLIVDIRPESEIVNGFLSKTYAIPLSRSFPNWAGWLLPYDKPIYLIANDEASANEAVKDLRSVGLDDVRGWFLSSELAEAMKPKAIRQVSFEQAQEMLKKGAASLDVRSSSEFGSAHFDGAVNIPLGSLENRIAEVPRGKTLVVNCGSGYRSLVAISILDMHGINDLVNLIGGYPAKQLCAS